MTTNKLFVDIACKQRNCKDERICGDTFTHKRFHTDNRTVIVLSDGMGHGVKANILSTLTASMLVNFAEAKEDIRKIAEIVLNNLPVCSVRKISYSTFTTLDIDHKTNEITIAEHDNPQSIIFRKGKPLVTEWDCLVINEQNNRLQTILTTRFTAQEDDRIIFMSDGITQSGLGSDIYPFGWGHKNVSEFLHNMILDTPKISAKDIASKLISIAIQNDDGIPKDDTTCVVVHIRKPKQLLICSCPPAQKTLYKHYAETVKKFIGEKIVCGYPIAEIIADELKAPITKQTVSEDPDIPPIWHIDGIGLVTEGIVTLNKVYDILNSKNVLKFGLNHGIGAAYEICKKLIESDEINIIMGTKRIVEDNSYIPDEFELRRKVLRRIGTMLEKIYMKDVNITFI